MESVRYEMEEGVAEQTARGEREQHVEQRLVLHAVVVQRYEEEYEEGRDADEQRRDGRVRHNRPLVSLLRRRRLLFGLLGVLRRSLVRLLRVLVRRRFGSLMVMMMMTVSVVMVVVSMTVFVMMMMMGSGGWLLLVGLARVLERRPSLHLFLVMMMMVMSMTMTMIMSVSVIVTVAVVMVVFARLHVHAAHDGQENSDSACRHQPLSADASRSQPSHFHLIHLLLPFYFVFNMTKSNMKFFFFYKIQK